jgi:single-strand DNA-binding protein
MLIGNLTRDPELRYTPAGTPVCTFGVATNRGWTTDTGDRKEETEFHRIVSWAKLAELCAKLLYKGRRVYLEGRLQTRQWTGQDSVTRSTTEVVIDDMLLLDSRKDRGPGAQAGGYGYAQDYSQGQPQDAPQAASDQLPTADDSPPSDSSDDQPATDSKSDLSQDKDQPASEDDKDEEKEKKKVKKPARGRKKKPTADQPSQSDESATSEKPDESPDKDQEKQEEESDDIPF